MNAKLAWQVGGIVVVLGILAAAWFLLISPQFASAKSAGNQRGAVDAQNASLQADVARLKQVNVSELTGQIATFQQGVPATSEVISLFSQVRVLVESTGASLSAITVGSDTAFAPTLKGATGDPKKDAATQSPPAGSSGKAAVPVSLLPVLDSDLQASVSAGLLTMTVTIQVSGSRDQILAAANALQAAGPQRQMTISTISVSLPSNGGPGIGTFGGIVFVLPLAPVDLSSLNQGSPVGTSPSPSPTPSSSPTPSASPSSSATPSNSPSPSSSPAPSNSPSPSHSSSPSPSPTP